MTKEQSSRGENGGEVGKIPDVKDTEQCTEAGMHIVHEDEKQNMETEPHALDKGTKPEIDIEMTIVDSGNEQEKPKRTLDTRKSEGEVHATHANVDTKKDVTRSLVVSSLEEADKALSVIAKKTMRMPMASRIKKILNSGDIDWSL